MVRGFLGKNRVRTGREGGEHGMLKKLMLLLCLGAFAVAVVGGCGKKPAEEKPKENGDKPVEPVGDEK